MKKVLLLILVSMILLLAFTSCDKLPEPVRGAVDTVLGFIGIDTHEHEWSEATCTSAQVCATCGERQGTSLPHALVEPTCTDPRTCTECGQTWGEANGHRWSLGSCAEARTCRTCGEVEGEAPGHAWVDATCDTPKTCSTCGETEGDKLEHVYVDSVVDPTCTSGGYTLHTCSLCGYKYSDTILSALGHLNDIVLEAVDVTCTTDGLTEGVMCSRCETATTEQNVIDAEGHDSESVITAPTCTEDGYTTNTCKACFEVYTSNVVPALGHDYGGAICGEIATCQREGCVDADAAKPIEHTWTPATCTMPMMCTRCYETDPVTGPATGHDMSEASCLAPKTCKNGCGYTEGVKDPHELEMSYVDSVLKYVCPLCQTSYKVENHLVLDGSGYEGMTPVNNKVNFTTAEISTKIEDKDESGNNVVTEVIEPTDNPVIKEDSEGNKYYELIKIETTDAKQIQLWVPSEDKSPNKFSSANNSVGFLSFKINTYMTQAITMRLIDGSASPNRWSEEWCITEDFFTVSAPKEVKPKEGGTATASETGDTETAAKTVVTVTGWNKLVLKEIDVTDSESKFTGWMDVIIGIVLNAETDTVTMHYYIDGKFVGSETKALTTMSNAVNCFYISGNTQEAGSGLMLDDIAFGYTVAGYWCFDGHDHEWKLSQTVTATCTTDGYNLYECECGSVLKDEVVVALGHLNDVTLKGTEPTCTTEGISDGKHCSRCNTDTVSREIIPALGHTAAEEFTVTDVTCTTDGYTTYTCTVCGVDYVLDVVPALGHDFGVTKCDEPGVCSRENCGFVSGDEPIGHDYAPATCTTPATCKREGCGAQTGDPIPHNMAPATCAVPSTCTYGCGYTEGGLTTHTLTYKYARKALKYICSVCDATFTLQESSYMNGSHHNGMSGAANSANYTVAPGSHNPALVDGRYELINTTGARGQLQLWIPNSNPHSQFGAFSMDNDAIGFLSFNISAYLTSTTASDSVAIKVTDNTFRNSISFDWSKHTMDVLTIKQSVYSNGLYSTEYVGLGGKSIVTVTSADKFGEFINIMIGMQLTSSTGQLTLYYYVDGELVSNYSVAMPIVTGKINSIYLSGYSSEKGSGIKLDDIGFGFLAGGEWLFDTHDHNYTTNTIPVSCTEDGYTISSCEDCGHIVITDVLTAAGHVEATAATCTAQATCEVCQQSYGEMLEHTLGTPATCTAQATCEICEQPYGEMAAHTLGTPATCTTQAVCKVCEQSYGTLSGHTPATAICQGDTTCSTCGEALKMTSHSLEAIHVASSLKYSCKHCGGTFTTEKNYYFDGTDSTFTNLFTQDENSVFNGDKNSMVINADGQYEFIHDDNTSNGKGVVWIPKNSGGASMFDGFNTKNNAVGIISFSINSYMTEKLALQFVDTTLRGVSGDFWNEGSISDGFFAINPPENNRVSVTGWAGEIMQIEVTDEDKWTGWIDVVIGVELSSADDTVTVHYYINGEYITSATRAMTITTDQIDGLYFNGRCNVAGGGYMLDNIGFGYSTKETWIFDKKD